MKGAMTMAAMTYKDYMKSLDVDALVYSIEAPALGSEGKVCCEYHKRILAGFKKAVDSPPDLVNGLFKSQEAIDNAKAIAEFGGTEGMIKYARDILMGRARHRQDPNRQVTVTCGETWWVEDVQERCENKVTGTPAQVGGEFKNRCETHRS